MQDNSEHVHTAREFVGYAWGQIALALGDLGKVWADSYAMRHVEHTMEHLDNALALLGDALDLLGDGDTEHEEQEENGEEDGK